jgi:hypothetical protein
MRDIAKDKEHLEWARKAVEGKYVELGSVYNMAEYWIEQYEAAQARISELEQERLSYTPLSAAKLPEHDIALKKVFKELGL